MGPSVEAHRRSYRERARLSELKYCRISDALSTTFSHDSLGDRKGACLVSSMFTRLVFVNPCASTSPLPVRPFLCSQSSAFDRGSERDNATFLRCQCSERDQSVRTGHGRNNETVKVVRNCARNQLTKRTRISLVRPHRSLWRGCCRVLGSPPPSSARPRSNASMSQRLRSRSPSTKLGSGRWRMATDPTQWSASGRSGWTTPWGSSGPQRSPQSRCRCKGSP